MPNWKQVLEEIQVAAAGGQSIDTIRRKYLFELFKKTGRNVIAYYSGFLQKPNQADAAINDKDKNAFMVTIHGMDRSLGLDLILHTPGGDLAATESLVDYLHSMFGNNIRAIIPQIAMSAGTMIAFSCKEIMMGHHSNLGPIDPQMGGVPCQAVLDEFEKAKADIKINPHSVALWQTIIGKYHPTFLGSCQNAIDWSEPLANDWLLRNMCGNDKTLVRKILSVFDHKTSKSHSRHISKQKCIESGLKIVDMEADNDLQDAILTIHHTYMHTLSQTQSVKIVENQNSVGYIESLQMQQFQMQQLGIPGSPPIRKTIQP